MDNYAIASNGKIGINATTHQAEMAPRIAAFFPNQETILLTLHVSSFDHIRGGLENSMFLGEARVVEKRFSTEMNTTMLMTGMIFVMGLFLLVFAIYRKHESEHLVFGIFSMMVAFRQFFAEPFYYTMMYPTINWLWGTRFEYIFTILSSGLFVVLLWLWHKEMFSKWVMLFLVTVHSVLLIITMFTQPVFFQDAFFKVFILAFPTFLYVIYIYIQSIRLKKPFSKLFIVGVILISMAFINDYALGQNWLNSFNLMLFAVTIFIIMHVILMGRRFAIQGIRQEKLNHELALLNTSLDDLVSERTMQLQEANELLKQLATQDDLTQTFNRNYFNTYIEEVFYDSIIYGHEKTLFMIDVDHFKRYNDSYGHVKGDELLKSIAQLIREVLPADTMLARYGGEEFAIVVEGISFDDAYQLGQKIRQQIEDAQYPHLSSDLGFVTISVGIATMHKNTKFEFTNQWISAADRQLYQYQFRGRNLVSQDDYPNI